MSAIIRRKMVQVYTQQVFLGIYNKHEVFVERENYAHPKGFYITVMSPDGTYSYDGWWGENDPYQPIDIAVCEALRGSQLIGRDCPLTIQMECKRD